MKQWQYQFSLISYSMEQILSVQYNKMQVTSTCDNVWLMCKILIVMAFPLNNIGNECC